MSRNIAKTTHLYYQITFVCMSVVVEQGISKSIIVCIATHKEMQKNVVVTAK